MKDFTKNDFKSFLDQFREIVEGLLVEHYYIFENSMPHEKEKISKFLRHQNSQTELENSIYFLSRLLYNYHKKRVFILIDEYDTPLQMAYVKDEQKY